MDLAGSGDLQDSGGQVKMKFFIFLLSLIVSSQDMIKSLKGPGRLEVTCRISWTGKTQTHLSFKLTLGNVLQEMIKRL